MNELSQITNTEDRLQQFSEISEPNSISPKVLADLLAYLLTRTNAAIQDIYDDASNLQVFAYNGGFLCDLLNDLDERITKNVQSLVDQNAIISTINRELAQAYKLPHIKVDSRDDDILKTLDSGTYSVIIGNMPYIMMVMKFAPTTIQYLMKNQTSNWSISQRSGKGNNWNEWKSYKFSFQEATYALDSDIENKFIDISPIPLDDCVIHVRLVHNDSSLEEGTGICCVHYRYDNNKYYMYIMTPQGVYSTSGTEGNISSTWSFNKFVFESDLQDITSDIEKINKIYNVPTSVNNGTNNFDISEIIELHKEGVYKIKAQHGITTLFTTNLYVTRESALKWKYVIETDSRIYTRKITQGLEDSDTGWQEKKIAFQSDIESILGYTLSELQSI